MDTRMDHKHCDTVYGMLFVCQQLLLQSVRATVNCVRHTWRVSVVVGNRKVEWQG